jgi:hypothetical protein
MFSCGACVEITIAKWSKRVLDGLGTSRRSVNQISFFGMKPALRCNGSLGQPKLLASNNRY